MMDFALGMLFVCLFGFLFWFFCNWFDDFISSKISREHYDIVSQLNKSLSTMSTMITYLDKRILELEKEKEENN